MTIIEQIKAEIERRMNGNPHYVTYKELESLLSFLSTLESEKPIKRLEEEIRHYLSDRWKFGCVTPITTVVLPNFTTEDLKECAHHFAEWGYLRAAEKYDEIEYNRQMAEEHLADARKTSPRDLEEAAKKYAEESCFDDPEFTATMLAYKAGAKWQKEQMMKEAVEGEVCILPGGVAYVREQHNEALKQYILDNFKTGDKVRIIIVKEGEK